MTTCTGKLNFKIYAQHLTIKMFSYIGIILLTFVYKTLSRTENLKRLNVYYKKKTPAVCTTIFVGESRMIRSEQSIVK